MASIVLEYILYVFNELYWCIAFHKMTSHFSILSIVTRPEIGEHIAVGLLLTAEGSVYFKESKRKLNIAKGLLEDPVYRYAQDCLRDLRQDVAQLQALKGAESLFKEQVFAHGRYSVGYLEYMNRYSNNVLAFTAPKQIEIAADEALADRLFHKYIDNKVAAPNEKRPLEQLSKEFYPRMRSHFNVEQKLTTAELPKLIVPVTPDLIGHNDRPVFAQKIDLERRMDFIQSDLGLVSMISGVLDHPHGFIISAEPKKSNYPEQHDAWVRLRQDKMTEYVDISEVERISEYAEKHNVQPLVK